MSDFVVVGDVSATYVVTFAHLLRSGVAIIYR